MTGTDHILFTHKQSRSYLNHLVLRYTYIACLVSSQTVRTDSEAHRTFCTVCSGGKAVGA